MGSEFVDAEVSRMKTPAVFLFLFSCMLLHAAYLFPGDWKAERNGAVAVPETAAEAAILRAEFPGGVLLYKEQPRFLFAPDRRAFAAGELIMEVRAVSFALRIHFSCHFL